MVFLAGFPYGTIVSATSRGSGRWVFRYEGCIWVVAAVISIVATGNASGAPDFPTETKGGRDGNTRVCGKKASPHYTTTRITVASPYLQLYVIFCNYSPDAGINDLVPPACSVNVKEATSCRTLQANGREFS